MSGRDRRLGIIQRIIKNNSIKSQDELLVHLRREGIAVTQATLSRDLKLLKVDKRATNVGGHRYTIPDTKERREREHSFALDFMRGYINVAVSPPLAVVHTLTGHADSVAFALDNLNIEAVLGTVAGNDTVFVALRAGVSQEGLLAALRERIPDFEG